MSVPPSYEASVVVAPPPNQIHASSRTINSRKNLLVTGILHLISGGILVLLGIIAIAIRAYWSYFATSIWTGLLIIGITGFLGVQAGRTGNRCVIHGYIAMSVVSSLTAFSLMFVYSFAAGYEYCYNYWGNNYCEYHCYPGGWNTQCVTSQAVRKMINSFIVITASFEMVLAIVSASFGCAHSCSCCGSCCRKCCNCCTPPPAPTTATFVNNRAGPAPITVQGVPQGGNIIVQGAPPNAGQPTFFIVQQAPINQYGAGPGTSAAGTSAAYPPPQANPAIPGQTLPPMGAAGYPPPQVNPGYVPEQTAAEIPAKQEHFVRT